MPRKGYQADLEDLRAAVLGLGSDVVDQVDRGLTALEADDADLARSVIDGDEGINERYLALEADCVDLIALQQPVASDLRLVVSSFKILTDIERIGDLATNFASYALAEASDQLEEDEVIQIGRDACSMVEDALTAYETQDVDRCHAVDARDDEIDALCQQASHRLVRELIGGGGGTSDSWEIEWALDDVSRLLLTIRDVERVADHAVNVAARTLYMAEQDSALLY